MLLGWQGENESYKIHQITLLFDVACPPKKLQYFWTTRCTPQIWEEHGGVTCSPNLACLAHWGRGSVVERVFFFSSSRTQVCLMVQCILQSKNMVVIQSLICWGIFSPQQTCKKGDTQLQPTQAILSHLRLQKVIENCDVHFPWHRITERLSTNHRPVEHCLSLPTSPKHYRSPGYSSSVSPITSCLAIMKNYQAC